MNKIPSFTINHEKLLRGIYVSRKDEVGGETVTTDLFVIKPSGVSYDELTAETMVVCNLDGA